MLTGATAAMSNTNQTDRLCLPFVDRPPLGDVRDHELDRQCADHNPRDERGDDEGSHQAGGE